MNRPLDDEEFLKRKKRTLPTFAEFAEEVERKSPTKPLESDPKKARDALRKEAKRLDLDFRPDERKGGRPRKNSRLKKAVLKSHKFK